MSGIYIHIPFCKQACNYCNFHFSTSLKYKDEMLQALLQEIAAQPPSFQQEKIETIYFGGGTPSLLSADELKRIIEAIAKQWDLDEVKECTLEANPDDISTSYLKALQGTLVNRFSMGVQSFYDEDLQWMQRAHNATQADYAIKAAQDKGFTNITLDLIYGTAHLTNEKWIENLRRVQAYQVPHFSAYALTVEEGTLLHHQIAKKKTTAPIEETAATQFELMQDFIEDNEWLHYEISNVARTGHEALHNSNYWRGKRYLGIGPSAHSYDGQKRWWNVSNNAQYLKGIKEQTLMRTEEILTPTQRLNEYVLTNLRTAWGIDLAQVSKVFGEEAERKIREAATPFLQQDHVQCSEQKLILTRKGMLYADGIAAALFQ